MVLTLSTFVGLHNKLEHMASNLPSGTNVATSMNLPLVDFKFVMIDPNHMLQPVLECDSAVSAPAVDNPL